MSSMSSTTNTAAQTGLQYHVLFIGSELNLTVNKTNLRNAAHVVLKVDGGKSAAPAYFEYGVKSIYVKQDVAIPTKYHYNSDTLKSYWGVEQAAGYLDINSVEILESEGNLWFDKYGGNRSQTRADGVLTNCWGYVLSVLANHAEPSMRKASLEVLTGTGKVHKSPQDLLMTL